MTKCKNSPGFKGHHFPSEIIEYAVWLYFRFSLSLRDVEDLLAERGIIVSHQTIRWEWIKDGTISRYSYNPDSAGLVLRG